MDKVDKKYVVLNYEGKEGGYEQESIHLDLTNAIRYYRMMKQLPSPREMVVCKVLTHQDLVDAETQLTAQAKALLKLHPARKLLLFVLGVSKIVKEKMNRLLTR